MKTSAPEHGKWYSKDIDTFIDDSIDMIIHEIARKSSMVTSTSLHHVIPLRNTNI